MNVYIIRIWRSPDPRFCSSILGVLDEYEDGDDCVKEQLTLVETPMPVSSGTRVRRMVFNGMDQLISTLETIGSAGEKNTM